MSPPGWRSRSPPGSLPQSISPQHRERRARDTGLIVSALLHLLLVALYPLLSSDVEVRGPPDDPTAFSPLVEGMEIIEIVELPETSEPAPEAIAVEQQEAAPSPAIVEVDAATGADETPDEAELEDELTIVQRLQPRMIDPRLWAPVDRLYSDLTDQERALLLLRGMIQSWNDSMAVAEALSDRATDWTYTDDEGRRWGLSPGRLHLGDFSIPLPFYFQVPPGRRDEFAQRQLIRDDLARGAATAIIRETWAERARAIRERLEAERTRPDPSGLTDDGGLQ